jgi:Ca2+-transporting ATPase
LVSATNRAWDTGPHSWWRLPLKSLLLLVGLVGAILLGIPLPRLGRLVGDWLIPANESRSWVYVLTGLVGPSVVAFVGLTMFYKLAPRRPTRLAEVWGAGLCATALLQVAESLFAIYLRRFATLNAVYGAFGGVMALLLWIYLSGCIIIFGACLSAARTAGPGHGAVSA